MAFHVKLPFSYCHKTVYNTKKTKTTNCQHLKIEFNCHLITGHIKNPTNFSSTYKHQERTHYWTTWLKSIITSKNKLVSKIYLPNLSRIFNIFVQSFNTSCIFFFNTRPANPNAWSVNCLKRPHGLISIQYTIVIVYFCKNNQQTSNIDVDTNCSMCCSNIEYVQHTAISENIKFLHS